VAAVLKHPGARFERALSNGFFEINPNTQDWHPTRAIVGKVVAIVGAMLLSAGGFFLWRKCRWDLDYQSRGAMMLDEPKQSSAVDYCGSDSQGRRRGNLFLMEMPLRIERKPKELPAEQRSSPKIRIELPA
jgi:hypothetical protein